METEAGVLTPNQPAVRNGLGPQTLRVHLETLPFPPSLSFRSPGTPTRKPSSWQHIQPTHFATPTASDVRG